jgi:hypothetical protein
LQLGAARLVRANAFPGMDFTGKMVEISRRMGRKNLRTDDPPSATTSRSSMSWVCSQAGATASPAPTASAGAP